MLLLKIPSFLQLTYLSAACIGSYWLYRELTIGRSRRQLARKHGCKPAKRARSLDPILGLDMLFKTSKWTEQHILLEKMHSLLFADGTKTAEFNFLRYITIFTTEADNIKAVLSTNFKSFGLPDRPKELDLLLGDGIFTSEGQAWHQSRELLRPCFARSQVADLDMLETHVRTLVDKIPRDGSTVDLSKLFLQFTLSVAIDFLFGEDGEGDKSVSDVTRNDSFVEVWDRVSNFLVEGGQSVKALILRNTLERFRTNPQYKRDCQMIHGEYPSQATSSAYSTEYH